MLDPRLERVIERMGQMSASKRFGRTAGRIFSLLMLNDRSLSLDDLVEILRVSRASVSTETRRLEAYGMLERVSRPGDRRDYYQVTTQNLRRMMRGELAKFAEMERLFRETLAVADMSDTVRRRVDGFCEFQHSMQELFTDLLERWEGPDRSATPDEKKVG